jgi:hypothetical protein
MRRPAIRLLTLAICATALMAAPAITATRAEAGSHGHLKKHGKHKRSGFGNNGFGIQPGPLARPTVQTGPVCPGIGRAFECRIWPPPYEDDPDRKVSKY